MLDEAVQEGFVVIGQLPEAPPVGTPALLSQLRQRPGHVYQAKIVNICAAESILNDQGRVDPRKLRPITFDPMNNTYVVLGKTVGQAFKDGAALK